MKTFLPFALLCALTLVLTGCASSKLITAQAPGEKVQSQVIHNSFYGFRWAGPDPIIEKAKLYSVSARTNMLYSFVSVASLGFYVPQELEWTTIAVMPPDFGKGGVKPRLRK